MCERVFMLRKCACVCASACLCAALFKCIGVRIFGRTLTVYVYKLGALVCTCAILVHMCTLCVYVYFDILLVRLSIGLCAHAL